MKFETNKNSEQISITKSRSKNKGSKMTLSVGDVEKKISKKQVVK